VTPLIPSLFDGNCHAVSAVLEEFSFRLEFSEIKGHTNYIIIVVVFQMRPLVGLREADIMAGVKEKGITAYDFIHFCYS
jgi:hypothetical protein